MKEFGDMIQAAITVLGGWFGDFLEGSDGRLYVLIVFMAMDYIVGITCAVADNKLSRAGEFKRICRKVLIIVMVDVGHLLDIHVIGTGGVLRTVIIYFYISHEGLSLVENAEYLGLPIPSKLHKILRQLHDRAEQEDEEKGEG